MKSPQQFTHLARTRESFPVGEPFPERNRVPLNNDRLFGRRDETCRRVSLGRKPFRYSHFPLHGGKAIRATTYARYDPAAVNSEYRMVPESQHLNSVRVHFGNLARLTQNGRRRVCIEFGALSRHHTV